MDENGGGVKDGGLKSRLQREVNSGKDKFFHYNAASFMLQLVLKLSIFIFSTSMMEMEGGEGTYSYFIS